MPRKTVVLSACDTAQGAASTIPRAYSAIQPNRLPLSVFEADDDGRVRDELS
jgi:hypothetical protein